MDYKNVTIASSWIAVAAISIVYMLVFADRIGDILFGLFLPIGALVLIATFITIYAISNTHEHNQKT